MFIDNDGALSMVAMTLLRIAVADIVFAADVPNIVAIAIVTAVRNRIFIFDDFLSI